MSTGARAGRPGSASCHSQPTKPSSRRSRHGAKDLATMSADESLWPSGGSARGVTSGTFYGNLRRYLAKAGLPLSGVHISRHSAAKLRRDAGESIEDVSRFLDHSSLAVTTTYLRRLEGLEDRSWSRVAAAIGV